MQVGNKVVRCQVICKYHSVGSPHLHRAFLNFYCSRSRSAGMLESRPPPVPHPLRCLRPLLSSTLPAAECGLPAFASQVRLSCIGVRKPVVK